MRAAGRDASRSWSPTAAASTARISRAPPTALARMQVLCVTADSPSYPRRHRDLAEAIARAVPPAARDHPHQRARAARVPRQPGQSLLLTARHELYDAPGALAARPRLQRDRRRQQRRRSRRLPARAGRRRASSACAARSTRPSLTKDGDSRAVAGGGPADLGRAGIGVPVVAHPVSERGHRGRSWRRSSRPKRSCARSDSASSASAITTRSRGSRSAATRWRAPSSPRSTRRWSAGSRPSATSTSASICRATAPAASTKCSRLRPV